MTSSPHHTHRLHQVYVALSRVVSLAGLYVSGMAVTQAVVKAHADVKRFYGVR